MSFGTFNPNFYGITQSFSDPEWLDQYSKYAQEDDVAKWRDAQQNFEFDQLGALSAKDHELRHFHDFLISPWSIERMIWRLNASMSGFFAVQNIRAAAGGHVPLPVSRWMSWSEAERETWLRTSGTSLTSLSDLVRLSSVDFSKPMNPSDWSELDELFPGAQENASRSYRRLSAMRARHKTGMGFGIAVDDVFEASAHVLHATAIYHGQGGYRAYAKFWEFVQASSTKSLQPLKVAITALQTSLPDIDAKRTLEIFTWMLLGHFDSRHEHPDVRFGLVLHIARTDPEYLSVELDGTTETFWDFLDAVVKARPWKDNLRFARDRAHSRVNELEAHFSQLSEEFQAFPNSLLAVARLWEKDVGTMVDQMTKKADHYCNPNHYLYNSIHTFPAPFILFHYGQHTYKPPDDFQSWPNDEIRPVFADIGKKRMLYYVISPEPRKEIGVVTDVFAMQRIMDFIFSEELSTRARALDKFYFQHVEPLLGKPVQRVF